MLRKNRKIRYRRADKHNSAQNSWALKALIHWFVAGGLSVSFTASAGYAPQDLAAQAATSESATSFPKLPLEREDFRPAKLDSFVEEAVKVTQVYPTGSMLFDSDIAVYTMSGFEGVAYAYDGFMPRVLLEMPHMDGATETATLGDTAPAISLEGTTSPSLLSALTARAPDGASPLILRAVALSSTTPAPPEPEIVIMPQYGNSVQSAALKPSIKLASLPTSIPLILAPKSSNYADLIDPRYVAKEQKCLAEAIYFEARSEPAAGQAAVAQVVLNRVKSGLYPTTVCGVVYQNRHRYMACQFSFACEGKSLRVTENGPWKQAVEIAKAVTTGKTYLTGVGTATHYHANYVSPTWSRRLKRTDKIGTHIFYKLRPGQA